MIEINRNPSPKVLRQFAGIWFPAFCALVAFWLWKGGAPVVAAQVAVGVGLVLGLLGLIAPPLIKPVFVGLSVLTFPIGWVVSNLVLVLAFFLIFTPIGLFMRLIGRDALSRRFDRAATTYWVAHDPAAKGPSRYFRQF